MSIHEEKLNWCLARESRMKKIKPNDKLLLKIKKWLDKNGNKYHFPTVTAFINNAIYEKLGRLNSKKEEKDGVQ